MAEVETSEDALRPKAYEALLSEPIVDDDRSATKVSDAGWELQHGVKRRFYVSGFVWFLKSGAISDAKLLHQQFAAPAIQTVANETSWSSMPGSGSLWQELSYNQLRHAQNGVPLFFQKAAIVIVACELALRQAIAAGRVKSNVATSGVDVYKNMRIIPACWNIDDFSESTLRSIDGDVADTMDVLRVAAEQSSPKVIDDLVSGFTVTRKTARLIKSYLDEHHFNLRVGRIRTHAGRNLGRKSASESETVDLS